MERGDDRGDIGDAAREGDTIEVDADVGLVLHALSTQEQSYAVVLCAARTLLGILSQPTLPQTQRRMFVRAAVESGALAALWNQLAMYFDRKDFVLAALELVGVILDADIQKEVAFPSTKDFLATATQLSRHAATHGLLDCAVQLLLVLERLVPLLASRPAEYELLVHVVTKLLVAPFNHVEVVMSCFRCISEVVLLAEASFKLSEAAINVILKVLITQINCSNRSAQESAPIALAALPVVLKMAREGQAANLQQGLTAPVVLNVLFAASHTRGLSEAEAHAIETFLGDAFHFVIKKFCNESNGYSPAPVSIALTQNLAFALLWSSHAGAFLEIGGVCCLLGAMEESISARNKHALITAACALHHLCATKHREASNAIEESQGLERLMRYTVASKELASDELMDHLLAIISHLADHDNFADAIIDNKGLELMSEILKDRVVFPLSSIRTIRLLSELQGAEYRRLSAAGFLVESLGNVRASLGIDSSLQRDFIRAMLFSVVPFGEANREPMPSSIMKDLVRMMRARMEDSQFLVDLCKLFLRLMTDPIMRLELVDNGIMQMVAKAMYLHERQCPELRQLLSTVLTRTAHSVDATRNASILQTLVLMWKQSLAPPSDMDTFVESLELNCYVNVALSRLKPLSGAVTSGNVKTNLCQILRNSVQDHTELTPQAFSRITMCCVYALQPLLAPQRAGKGDAEETAHLHNQAVQANDPENGILFDTLELVVECVGRIVDHDGEIEHQALTLCCRFVDHVFRTHRLAVDVAIKAGWLPIASKILLSSTWYVDVRVSVMSTTVSILVKDRSQGRTDNKLTEGLWDVFVASGNRLAAHGPVSTDSSCLTLTLRNLELIAWSSEYRSHTLIMKCLTTLHRIADEFGFDSSPSVRGCVFKSASSILQGLCTEAFLDKLMQQAQDLCSSWDNSNEDPRNADERSGICAALTMVLLVDERDGILKKLSLRRPMGEIAARTLEIGFDRPSSRVLQNTVATGVHLLNGPDRDRVLQASIASLNDTDNIGDDSKPRLLWFHNCAKWSEGEVDHAVQVLIEAITVAAQDDRFATVETLCLILTYLLSTALRKHSERQVLNSRDRVALGAVCTSILRQWVDPADGKGATSIGLQLVVHVIRLATTVLEILDSRGSRFTALGFEPEVLSTVCIHALGECCFAASSGSVDASICQSVLFENLLGSSSAIFRSLISMGADSARVLLQDSTVRLLLQLDSRTFGANGAAHVAWCWSLATALVQEHGALYGEKIFKLMPSPGCTMIEALTSATIDDADSAIWRSMADCVAVATDSTGWGQMSIQEHMQSVVASFESASAQTRHRSVSSPALSDSVAQIGTTRLSLVVLSLKLSSSRPTTSALASISEICMVIADMAGELFRNSAVFSLDQFAKLAATLLTIAQLTIRSAYADRVEEIVVSLFESLVQPLFADTTVLGTYVELAAEAFFEVDSAPASQQFLGSFPRILRTFLQDPRSLLAYGEDETRTHRALRAIFNAVAKWSHDDSNSLTDKRLRQEIAHVCIIKNTVLDKFLRSIFDQQDGVDILFEVAQTQIDDSIIAEEVLFFLHRNAAELRHKPVRAGRLEMALILQLVQSNCSVPSSEATLMTLSRLRTARSFRVIEAALVVLKTFARVKRCAIACCQAGGLQVLYDLLSSSVQDETISILTLEVCCYLTSYEENLVQPAVFPLLKLLFLITDAPDHGPAFVRLAFVVLDQCVALASPQFTYSLIQMARRHLWKWRGSCSDDEINQVVQKLYVLHIDQIQQRIGVVSDAADDETSASGLKGEEEAIRHALERYHSVVQLPSLAIDPSTASFIDVKTSVKTHSELSSDYGSLRMTLLQVRELVQDHEIMRDQSCIDTMIPSVARVVILHASVTTDVVCIAMDILSKLSFFLRPADLVALLDIRALLGSCLLHAKNSLPFTLFAACFCENIVIEARSDVHQAMLPMVQLLDAMMDMYPEDFDMTQSCMSSLSGLLTAVSASMVLPVLANPLVLLNRVFRSHAHDVSVMWNCSQCLQQLAPHISLLEKTAALETVTILLDVVRANLNHSFIVQLALTCIDSIEHREPMQIRQLLLEMDAIGSLVDAMGIHLDDETIVATSMHLLLRMLSISNDDSASDAEAESCAAAIESIVEKEGHLVILLVCRRQANSSRVCRLAVELLMTIVEVKEEDVANDHNQTSSATLFQERVVHELLSYDVLRLVFDIFDSFAFRSDSASLVTLLLELLYDLLCTQPGRDAVQQATDLHKLREIVDVVWVEQQNVTLLEAAIDCLVNAACSTNFTNVWCEFPQWLTETAASLHEVQASSPSIEKIIGILARLAIHPTIATEIARNSSQELLQILALVGDDGYLEASLLSLLSQLCFDSASIPVLIVFDAIPTVIERLAVHVEHGEEELLYTSLRFLMTMASQDDCIHSFQEKALHVLLHMIIGNTKTSSRLQQLAHDLINRTTNCAVSLSHKSPSVRHHASIDIVRPPEPPTAVEASSTDPDDRDSNNSDAGNAFHELLWQGAVFRVRRDPKQHKKRDRVMISLGESGEYLLFRNLSSEVHTVERVFVSQIEVLPNAEAVAMEEKIQATASSPKRKISFGKALSVPSLVRAMSRADCIFHLMIKQELVSLEASCARERREWEVALEWLVEHQQVAL